MTHLIRGKQAGVQNDLSAGILPEFFAADQLDRYGVNSQISRVAYDPVQSLLAVGTRETKFGEGQVYVFGQERVCVVFELPRRASVTALRFWRDKLVCLDSKNELVIFSLESKRVHASYSPPGTASVMHVDHCLEFVLLALQNGEVTAYDIDRQCAAPFRIPCYWREINSRARSLPVVALALHPRDVGMLLIGYSEGVVIYSFKQNKALKFFNYQLPSGAPGGEVDPAAIKYARSPKLTHAVWHPTGTFILACYEDASIVIWDPRDGRLVMARTLEDTRVDKPTSGLQPAGLAGQVGSRRDPVRQVAWCASQDPDETSILIAGAGSSDLPTKGISYWELGRTPNYATSSWDILYKYFESPKRQRIFPTPPGVEVVDFCLIPSSSPHFAGAQEPVYLIGLLGSGDITTLSFPNGSPIMTAKHLHPSLMLVHPFVTHAEMSGVERMRWLGMREKRYRQPPVAQGGLEATRPKGRNDARNILLTSHADGTVRIFDAGQGDEIENKSTLQIDVGRVLGRFYDLIVRHLSIASATGEVAVGMQSGEVLVFRWGINKSPGQEPSPIQSEFGSLVNIAGQKEPDMTEGLMPFTLLKMKSPVSAIKMSDVGFMAAGFEEGMLVVLDLRGPAIIYQSSMAECSKHGKRSSFRKSSHQQAPRAEWPVCLEFSVMTLEGENYSSILLHVGTNAGYLSTFKILPTAGNRYTVSFVGSLPLEDKVISISPIKADSGSPAGASQQAVASLRDGYKVNGVILVATQMGARVFRPATSRGAHKSWDTYTCYAAKVTRFETSSYALVGLFGDGMARAFSIPSLRELGSAKIDNVFDVNSLAGSSIVPSGHIMGWAGPSELALLNIWGTGERLNRTRDVLFNPERVIPPRPTISNFQWLAGQQYITPDELHLLIGGPDRPPSKEMIMQSRANERQRLADSRAAPAAGPTGYSSYMSSANLTGAGGGGGQQETYWSSISKAVSERTAKLGTVQDSMDQLAESSSNLANEAHKFVQTQKRNAVMGVVKGKFGL